MKNTIGTWPTMPLECVDDHVSDPVGWKKHVKNELRAFISLSKMTNKTNNDLSKYY